jgi:hypothetical protein
MTVGPKGRTRKALRGSNCRKFHGRSTTSLSPCSLPPACCDLGGVTEYFRHRPRETKIYVSLTTEHFEHSRI